MADGGGEPAERKEDMVVFVEDHGKGGENIRVSGMFFKAVMQSLILFGLETWVMTHHMGRALVGFQLRVAQLITGKQPLRLLNGSWEYPPLDMVMQEAVFEEMDEYVLKRHNTVT